MWEGAKRGDGEWCRALPFTANARTRINYDKRRQKQTLVDEVGLKLLQKLEGEEILRCQRLLTDDGLHGLHILANGVAGILHIL